MDRVSLCFGVHNHQPVGNFESVLHEATARAYQPFLERVRAHPDVRLTVHFTGSLLAWLREHAAATFDLVGELASLGQIELLSGGFYEPILAIVPDADKRGQIERLSAFLTTHFGVRPRGMWLAERVWEPHLPRTIREAGIEYVLLDDTHFARAGLDAETVAGYYLTEEQGHTLAVFPISQRLRYLTPFADVTESVRYLEGRRGGGAITVMDDGEKFGAWPGTHQHVYIDGWLDRFFEAMVATPWLALRTFSQVLDDTSPSGRVYLPAASYREMSEWVLSPWAAGVLASARRALGDGEAAAPMTGALHGGFWRGFLSKYPEVADTYWKMLRLSRRVHDAAATGAGDVGEAREALWRGQANDAYWHGVFGGCYLPHLRRAVKSALLDCERRLPRPAAAWWHGDGNGDGCDEIFVRTRDLTVTLVPGAGGTVTELGFLPRALDLADVFARRRESYHDRVAGNGDPGVTVQGVGADTPVHKQEGLRSLLAYDASRRASLVDGVVSGDVDVVDPVSPWGAPSVTLADSPFAAAVRAVGDAVRVSFTRREGDGPVTDKTVTVHDSRIEAHYRVRIPGGRRFAVQWNLALTGGDAPGRYLDLPGRPSLGSRGHATARDEVTLVDEWIGVDATLQVTPRADIAWGPVETVSVSEGGFERIHQGLAVLFLWPPFERSDETEIVMSVNVGARSA